MNFERLAGLFKKSDDTARGIGLRQEEKTSRHFKKLGWKLLDRNYRSRWGEIDLIFRDPKNQIVFMEVKFRASAEYGGGREAVRVKKQERIVKTALAYIRDRRLHGSDFRFDVAALTENGLEHIPNAFSSVDYTI